MEQLIGQTLNRYQIISLLGEGGMGAVFKAHDLTLERDVAVKVMHPHFARQSNFRERFLQEARTAARLDHPFVVQVFDFGQVQTSLYIVMEFIPGDNLKQMLQRLMERNAWILLNEAVQLASMIAQALDYAHNQGVLHRDIKPGNIMLKPKPAGGLPFQPILTDLGLAKLVHGQQLTEEGTSMGTPAYMSPEQALGQPTDARSDVYSLGILMYELATGQVPFPIKNLADAIRYHTQETPPSPRSLRQELPQALEDAILRALEKIPAKRFGDAGQFSQALADTMPLITDAPTAAPTALESAVSLMTQYEQSLLEPRGGSIIGEFEAPSTTSRDSIQVMGKDKTTTTVGVEGVEMTIGRTEDNNIVLESTQVSRHHAKVSFDGRDYQVIDLNSTNGTYLGNTKLLPGVAEVWTPETPVRIGDFYLRLIRGDQAKKTGMYMSDGTAVSPSLIRTSPGEGRIGVFLEMAQFSVEPGGSISIPLILQNQGDVVDHFSVSLEGIPTGWLPTQMPQVQLLPGNQQQVNLTIQPSRSPKSRAGRYPCTILVSSQDAPEEVARVKCTLTLAAYAEFSSQLHPQQFRAGKATRVTINNQGNTLETYDIVLKDRGDELIFTPDELRLRVSEGQTASGEFTASPRKTRWFGASRSHPITAQISTLQGETQLHAGEFISKARFPAWIIPVLLFSCILFASAAAFFYNRNQQQTIIGTQTAIAGETAIALAATNTADALLNANLATQQAATATATWLGQDDDRDGITNAEEIALGTLPNKRDTDEDGLDDGDEQIWGTDLLKPDSDGDGLKDGDEVRQGIDPLNTDTDGDGEPDASDPDPGRVPTPTPTITPSPTPAPPPDGVSLICDDTFQRFQISDGGVLGKTATLENWDGDSWASVWAVNSGDPNEQQFEDEAGLYSFGGCEQLIVIPVRHTGSGAVLQLVIYAWDGNTLNQVYEENGVGGSWRVEGDSVRLERSVYLFGEPNCCPCNREIVFHRWTGTEFVEESVSLEPTYTGTPPSECSGGGGVQVTLIPLPPILLITPLPIFNP